MTVPTIACLLFGGVISDRFDRRRIMLCADLGRALVVGVLAALALAGALTFSGLVVSSRLYGVGAAFFTPAFEAIVPGHRRPRRSAAGERARPVRPADRAPARRPCARRRARRPSSASGSAFALDAGSFVVSAIAVFVTAPAGVAQPAIRVRPSRPSPTASGSCAATCGCGERCCRPRSRISPSWGRPRRSSRSSSRTRCTARRATSDSSSQRAASAPSEQRSSWASEASRGGT